MKVFTTNTLTLGYHQEKICHRNQQDVQETKTNGINQPQNVFPLPPLPLYAPLFVNFLPTQTERQPGFGGDL